MVALAPAPPPAPRRLSRRNAARIIGCSPSYIAYKLDDAGLHPIEEVGPNGQRRIWYDPREVHALAKTWKRSRKGASIRPGSKRAAELQRELERDVAAAVDDGITCAAFMRGPGAQKYRDVPLREVKALFLLLEKGPDAEVSYLRSQAAIQREEADAALERQIRLKDAASDRRVRERRRLCAVKP